MSKAIITGTTAAVSNTTIVDNLMLGVTSPLAILSKEDEAEGVEYYSKKSVGQAVLVGAAAGFVAGDIFGDRVPVLGGRR